MGVEIRDRRARVSREVATRQEIRAASANLSAETLVQAPGMSNRRV